MKPIALSLFFSFLWLTLVGQTPVYDFSWKTRKPHLITSVVFWGGTHLQNMLTKNDGVEDLNELNPKYLWKVDRFAPMQNSISADKWSDHTFFAALALAPIVHRKSKDDRWTIALLGLHGFFVENGLNRMVKTIAERPRPYIYREGAVQLNQILRSNDERSFYSGHTSGAAYFGFFAAKTFSDVYPHSKWKPVVWTLGITLPAVTGYLRYKAGKHFPTDVVVGYLAGATIGYLIPVIYKNKSLELNPHPTGFNLSIQL